MRHYFNSVSRYYAMETEFKPKAISAFERQFGAFDKDYSGNALAQYTKEFINDVNGNPSHLEQMLNALLNRSKIWRTFFVAHYGDRAAISLVNDITSKVSYLTLGMLNVSSAVLNLTQLINTGGYLGGYGRIGKTIGRLAKNGLTYKDIRILEETGVFNEIGLDTATGYDQLRGGGSTLDKIGQSSMWLFQKVDSCCRIVTTHEQAMERLNKENPDLSLNQKRKKAAEFAKDINRKANFDYGVADAPGIFRRGSVLSKLSLQFMKYPFKQMEIVWNMMPFSKSTNFAQKAAFWSVYFATVGLLGLIPGFDWINKKLGDWFHIFPQDFIQKTAVQGEKIYGKEVADMIMYGAFSHTYFGGVDMSKRAGLAGMVPQEISGAAISKLVQLFFNTLDGEYLANLRVISPGMYNLYAAIQGETHTKRGRLDMEYDSVGARVRRALGFKSAEESYASDMQRIKYDDAEVVKLKKQAAVDRYIEDPTPENLIAAYKIGVTKRMIKQEMKRKKSTRLERTKAGMTKQERKDHEYLFDFAEDDD